MVRTALPLMGLSVLLVACGGGGGDAPAPPSPEAQSGVPVEPCPVGDLSATAVPAINALRSAAQVCGGANFPAVGAVTWDARLAEAARRHSADMAAHNFFSHTGSDGSTVDGRVTAVGYPWSTVAENLASGPASQAAVLSGWMNSPGHCQNLMRASVTQVGLACARRQSGDRTPYWILVLARP